MPSLLKFNYITFDNIHKKNNQNIKVVELIPAGGQVSRRDSNHQSSDRQSDALILRSDVRLWAKKRDLVNRLM